MIENERSERAYLSRLWFRIAVTPSRTAGDWERRGCRQVLQAHREYWCDRWYAALLIIFNHHAPQTQRRLTRACARRRSSKRTSSQMLNSYLKSLSLASAQNMSLSTWRVIRNDDVKCACQAATWRPSACGTAIRFDSCTARGAEERLPSQPPPLCCNSNVACWHLMWRNTGVDDGPPGHVTS